VSSSEEMLLCDVKRLAEPEAAAVSAPEPDLPVTIIERRPGWHFVDVGELWRFRELLLFLTWRDGTVRYKQTVLGAAWAILQPFATMVVFSLFFGRVGGQASADPTATPVPYPLFVFAGLLPWFFFANAMASASQSVVGNQNLVTKIYFPRLIIPIGAVGAGVVDFLVAFAMLLVMMVWYGVSPGWEILMVPLLALGLLISSLGVGILLSALTVAYRDFRYVVPFLVQLWMFATPSIYMQNTTALSPRSRILLLLNPVEGWINNFRRAILGDRLEWTALAAAASLAIVCLLLGCLYFRRVERTFADII
jgi:lipopolysaccharide transport system permease protein